MSFFTYVKNLFSIDEIRVSSLIFTFIITLGFGLYKYYISNTIDNNMLTLLLGFITSIAGLSITNTVVNYKQNNLNNINSSEVINNNESTI